MAAKRAPYQTNVLVGRLHGYVRHLLVPHKANQYRPHLVRRYGLAAVLLVAAVAWMSSVRLPQTAVLGAEARFTPAELLTLSNKERTANGEAPLAYNPALAHAAYLKAQDMFAKHYWAHVAPDGTTPWSWFKDVGYNYQAAGENLAKNFPTAQATTVAWMASPEHRQNILNKNYQDVGYAVLDGTLDGKATTLVVALYGQPAATPAVSGAAVVSAPPRYSFSPLTWLGLTVQSLSPAVLGALILLLLAASVALAAHAYRRKLPRSLRDSWYRHHGAMKAVGLLAFIIFIINISAGGQI